MENNSCSGLSALIHAHGSQKLISQGQSHTEHIALTLSPKEQGKVCR